MDNSNWRYWMSILAVGATISCGPSTGGDPIPPNSQPTPTLGQSEFVSADGVNGQASEENEAGNENNANNADFAADDSNERVAEEGDIYRVSQTDGLILNLNAFRGLQIIDFSDPANPEIIGRAQVSGTPVEMYQVDDRVYILMNNWWGYYGVRSNIATQQYNGGLVAVVDISDVKNPKITARAQVPGYIRTSRLTRGGGDESLYVVANDWQTDSTYVKSFSVADSGDLVTRSQIDLDGYVQDIAATGDRLIVSRWDWSQNQQGSEVALIDISNPNGTMREGASVRVQGYVSKKSDMSIEGDVLRVASGNTWRANGNTNYVETFNASDISSLTKIDEETFGDGEQLFATLFLESSAFFVTYEQVDPFHTFSISAAGEIVEESEFIVSGFNTWLKPVSDETRLIGIGINDENANRAPAVSLYNIEDLTNPNPLVDRDELPLDWSWSEANWDDRAFSVLEKGANVAAPTGELETGLVLLPFNGWDGQGYRSGVQIFTFSDETVTKRGIMMHDTPVRRSFIADSTQDLTGNMSEMELSLFDTADVDNPSEVSRLALAPNYNNLMIFGSHGARRLDRSGYWNWWGSNGNLAHADSVQIFALASDPDSSKPLAEISVPANSTLHQLGDQLAVVSSEFVSYDETTRKSEYLTSIGVWDLSDPVSPTFKGATTSSKLPPVFEYYDYWLEDDCFDCSFYYYYGQRDIVNVVGDALVFSEYVQQTELVGHEYITSYYPKNDRWDDCYDENYEPVACSYLEGYRSCSHVEKANGGGTTPEVCQGEFFSCTQDSDGSTDCQPAQIDDSKLEINKWDHELNRYWNQQNLHVVDVSNPSAPTVVDTVLNGVDEEAVNVLPRGDKLHFTYKQPHEVAGDSRAYVKFYLRTFDFSNPAQVARASDINIPGELVEIDGATIFTRDFLWGENIVETSINRLEVANGAAYLRGIKRFEDEVVDRVMLDGAGQVLVTHQTAWYVNYSEHGSDWEDYDQVLRLSILSTTGSFDTLSEFDVDNWATLQGTIAGRALFQVPGGMLIVNTSNVTQPFAQAFFPLRGWAQQFTLEGDDAYVAAGHFGLYKFDLDTFNLLAP